MSVMMDLQQFLAQSPGIDEHSLIQWCKAQVPLFANLRIISVHLSTHVVSDRVADY